MAKKTSDRTELSVMQITKLSSTKALKEDGDFQKKPLVNRYIELCNPLSRISNSFPRIGNSFPRIGNSFPRIGNSFPRIGQSVFSDCKSHSLELDNSFSRIAIRSLELDYP